MAQTINGVLDVSKDCTNQAEFPMMASMIISMERSCVFFVVNALYNCGTKINVVNIAANQPDISSALIILSHNYQLSYVSASMMCSCICSG